MVSLLPKQRVSLHRCLCAASLPPCQSGHWWTAYLARTNHIWLLSVTVNYTLCASCPPAAAAQWQRSHLITTTERSVCCSLLRCAAALALSSRCNTYIPPISVKFLSSAENEEIKRMCESRSGKRKEKLCGFINDVVLCLMLICIDSVLLNEAVFVSNYIDAELNTN